MLRDPIRCSVTGNRSRSREEGRDDETNPERAGESEDQLPDDGDSACGEYTATAPAASTPMARPPTEH